MKALKMKNLASAVIALATLTGAAVPEAQAAVLKKHLAGADIWPCTRMESYRDDLGITWPTVRTARQTTDVVLYVDSSGGDLSMAEVDRIGGECNEIALVVAGGAGLITLNPEAFLAAYEPSFDACFVGKLAGKAVGLDLRFESVCHW